MQGDNGANSAKWTSKGKGEGERGDAIGDSAWFFARSEVRCIILLEWIIHTRHLHGMRKSRSFINSSPSREGDPWFASPSQRPTLSPPSPPPSEGRKEKRKKGTREGEETSSFDNPLLSHLVNARCAKKFSLWESHQNSIPPPSSSVSLWDFKRPRFLLLSAPRGDFSRHFDTCWLIRPFTGGARSLSLVSFARDFRRKLAFFSGFWKFSFPSSLSSSNQANDKFLFSFLSQVNVNF